MDAWNSDLWSNGYFRWLKDKIDAPNEYGMLLSTLHRIPYVYFIGNDSNRAVDGMDLRYSFMSDNNLMNTDYIYNVFKKPCSFFEMCIGLSDRMDFMLYRPAEGSRAHLFFWEMMDNLGLKSYTNANISSGKLSTDDIFRIVDMVNMRTYGFDGKGGLFPLQHTMSDQRDIELWDQMSEYVNEKYMVYDFLSKS